MLLYILLYVALLLYFTSRCFSVNFTLLCFTTIVYFTLLYFAFRLFIWFPLLYSAFRSILLHVALFHFPLLDFSSLFFTVSHLALPFTSIGLFCFHVALFYFTYMVYFTSCWSILLHVGLFYSRWSISLHVGLFHFTLLYFALRCCILLSVYSTLLCFTTVVYFTLLHFSFR
jgi:hypothetical protein